MVILTRHRPVSKLKAAAFTLIELLAAVALFSIIMVVIFGLTQQAGNAWRSTSSKIEAFQGARAAFEMITDALSQATLNTYYDYQDASGNRRSTQNAASFVPDTYTRYSDLHFLSGQNLVPSQVSNAVFFQTPGGYSASSSFKGLDTLLNVCGFYVRYDKDSAKPAFFSSIPNAPADRYRYRLYEFLQPSEQFKVFDTYSSDKAEGSSMAWFKDPLSSGAVAPSQIAENIVALVVLPKISDQDKVNAGGAFFSAYEYDSRDTTNTSTLNQLPPLVDVVMVAIDENSARRIEDGSAPPNFGVGGLFKDPSKLDGDLKSLESTLVERNIRYQVFRTTVALRNSKWSSQ